MNKVSGQLLSLLLAAVYVLSYAGFGVHTCHDDGSRHFVWMLGDVSCEAIHHHSHGEDHDHHHDGHCCTTQVYVLTDAQDSDSGNTHVSAPEMTVPVLFESLDETTASSSYITAFAEKSPPLKLIPTQSLLSVWRV